MAAPMQPARGRRSRGRRSRGRRGRQSWSAAVVCIAIHQHSWSTVVVGAAIIARGRRSRFWWSWSALVVVAASSARGRCSWSALCDQRS